MTYTATYSPEDNKIRLYASSRLDAETYARVKAAGFIWAPKQGFFVAPMWTPERADLAEELAGEIGDEDTSLVDRATERAERFEDYSDSRKADADAAHKAVSAICDGIPLGQPILVGHHSEKHARRDAEKIENGMRRAVKMWETSQYWRSRAAGAIRAAKYKERPGVRARRIKGLEADLRSHIAGYTPHENVPTIMQTRWNAGPDAQPEPHAWVGPKGRGGTWVPVASLPGIKARAQRWIDHITNRLEYERAMLADSGGLAAEAFDIQIGGRVMRRGEWFVVTKVNRRDGAILSVTILGRWASTIPIEEIKDYREPASRDAEKVQAATELAPLVNFRADGCIEMTSEEWKRAQRCSDSYFADRIKATETSGAYRIRTALRAGGMRRVPVFLTDSKVIAPPPAAAPVPAPDLPVPPREVSGRPTYHAPEPNDFDAMRETLKVGVQVVTAPQLFPTPPDLAARMVQEAGLQPWQTVLEPSAGTGAILRAIEENMPMGVAVTAVEINAQLCAALHTSAEVRTADFLQCNGDLGQFDRIIMNPPFGNAADIQHITHAIKMLRPGGRLVAICANGPRQNEKLKPLAENSGGSWEPLPPDTFKDSGTSVNAVLLTIEAQ